MLLLAAFNIAQPLYFPVPANCRPAVTAIYCRAADTGESDDEKAMATPHH